MSPVFRSLNEVVTKVTTFFVFRYLGEIRGGEVNRDVNRMLSLADFLCVELFLYLQKQNAMKQTIIHKLQDFFSIQPIEKAWIFGSYSRGEETKDSDMDILVRFIKDANITLFKYVSIANALQELLHIKIDLVEEGQLKDFAKDSAERDKILIYERETKG